VLAVRWSCGVVWGWVLVDGVWGGVFLRGGLGVFCEVGSAWGVCRCLWLGGVLGSWFFCVCGGWCGFGFVFSVGGAVRLGSVIGSLDFGRAGGFVVRVVLGWRGCWWGCWSAGWSVFGVACHVLHTLPAGCVRCAMSSGSRGWRIGFVRARSGRGL